MKPSFHELVEIDELQSLCDIFSKLTGFGTAILDMEGNVLVATNWREICTEFHRKNPESAEVCQKSDTILGELPSPGAKYRAYRCNNGLVDVSVPIMLENLQVGRLYTGQFLLAPPDIEFFRCQAARYGFDEASYLESVQKVQIVTEEQVGQVMEFLCRLAELIGRMGLGNQRLLEANEELRESRQELKHRVDERTAELSEKNEQLQREIAERRHAEEALHFTQFAIDKTIDQAFWMTEDGRFFYVNDAACRTLGYTREELIGMSVTDIGPTVPPEVFAAHWRDLQENGSVTLETLHRAKDGRVYPVEVRANYVVFDGREYNCAFATDISERKIFEETLRESEEKFRVMAETSPAAIFLFQEENIIYANTSTERLTGYSQEELSRMKFWDWSDGDFKELVRSRGLARLRGEPVPTQYESRFITKDSEEKWSIVSAGRIEFRGKPAVIATLLDITDIKAAEEQIRTSLTEKEVLLKEVHHRVKNNLQIISTLLDLQFEKIVDEPSLKALRESQDRIKAMALLHEKLYQSSDLASIDFAEYMEKLALFLFNSHMADQDRINLKVDVGHLPLDIDRAIPCGLIVNELVSNALKYAFPGDRSGTISIIILKDKDDRITLTVADTGVGMPPGLDFRNTETLGLQLVNMLARQLGGQVSLESGSGTAFTIRFLRSRQI
jgi:PAS domain S-box-containing protein